MEEELEQFNIYCRQLNKDLTNLMKCLKKQDEDNKAILYAGRHVQKIILPVEEYKKMCQRLESIDNVKPSEALERLEDIYRNGVFISNYDALGKQHPTNISPETNKSISEQCNTIKQYVLKAQENEKILSIIKENNIDIELLRYRLRVKDDDVYSHYKYDLLLPREKFDLLRRWVKE